MGTTCYAKLLWSITYKSCLKKHHTTIFTCSYRKIGAQPLVYSLKHGQQAKAYAINPKAGKEMMGIPCLPSMKAVSEAIDPAIIACLQGWLSMGSNNASKRRSPSESLRFGLWHAGEKGKRMQQEMVETVRLSGMRLIGPNCKGAIKKKPEATQTKRDQLSILTVNTQIPEWIQRK